jgi:hypothetical protein
MCELRQVETDTLSCSARVYIFVEGNICYVNIVDKSKSHPSAPRTDDKVQ